MSGDVIDFICWVLGKWVTETAIVKPNYRLSVLECEDLRLGALKSALRWTV